MPDGRIKTQLIGVQVRAPIVEVIQSLSDIKAVIIGKVIFVTWCGNDSASVVKVQSSNQVISEMTVEKGVYIATISNLDAGLAYSITITPAGKTDANSAKSVVVTLPPSIPTNLQVAQIGSNNIRVSWVKANIDFQYRVVVITSGEPTRTIVTNKSSVEIDVKPGVEYEVMLVAIGAGEAVSGAAETKIRVSSVPVIISTQATKFSLYYGAKKFIPNKQIQKTLNLYAPKIKNSTKLTCIAYVSATKYKSMAISIAKKQSVNTCAYLTKGRKVKSVSTFYKLISEAPKGKPIPKGSTRVDVVVTN
jgi:hypothetical protein